MKSPSHSEAMIYFYSSCPICQHPNIHVENGVLKNHTVEATSIQCLGSGRNSLAERSEPISRNSIAHRDELKVESLPSEPSAFATWIYGGVQYLCVECDGRFHIMDQKGRNYGAWMSMESFRKRQQRGGPQEWSTLGKAVARIIPV